DAGSANVGSRAYAITGVSADEAVAVIDGAADPGRATPPRGRPAPEVPLRAADHVIAIAQGGDTIVAHQIPEASADEAVSGIDGAADPGRAAPPRHCPARAVPARAPDHALSLAHANVAFGAYPITGVSADEAVAGIDGAADPGRAAPPRRCSARAVP